jgi:hypothetical protein
MSASSSWDSWKLCFVLFAPEDVERGLGASLGAGWV